MMKRQFEMKILKQISKETNPGGGKTVGLNTAPSCRGQIKFNLGRF